MYSSKTVVDSLSITLWAASITGDDYNDGFFTTSDDWTAETLTVWGGRPAKGNLLTSWINGYFIEAKAASTPDWINYANAQVNGDGIMSLCLENVNPMTDPNQRQAYYGRVGGGADPKLTITYHYELMPAPSNCAEAIARGYGFDGDFNSDCYVNMKDFSMFAKYWLDTIN
jgi:hypothetical protein